MMNYEYKTLQDHFLQKYRGSFENKKFSAHKLFTYRSFYSGHENSKYHENHSRINYCLCEIKVLYR